MKKQTEIPREYYSADTMLRYNPLWAFILGERSCGKSFEFKRRSITTPNTIYIYLRRTDVDRKDPKNWKSYLSDLLLAEKIDPDREYKCNSEGIWVDGLQKVIFSALSTDSSAHSMNYLPDDIAKVEPKGKKKEKEESEQDYDSIIDDIAKAEDSFDTKKELKKKIVFEEILEPKQRYLKNEVTQLFEFYNTVDRYSGTQLFGIANLMSAYNPYFDYFGITPFTQEFKWFKNKTLLVQNVKLKGMENFVKSQRFYNLVEGTEYADYLCNNTPWQDDKCFIENRPTDSRLVYNIRLNDTLLGIWTDEQKLYISEKNNPQYCTFSGLKSRQMEDIPIRKNEGAHKLLNTAMENGDIRYESIPMRDMVMDAVLGRYKEM